MIERLLRKLKVMFRDIIINSFAASKLLPKKLRYVVYKAYGIKSETKSISPGCFFGDNKVKIGKGTFVNYNCFFDNNAEIVIGDNCSIAMNVLFCTSSHETSDSARRAGKVISGPINVGDGCWIGVKSTILPGVNIGEGCVIAAGSVVTKDCKPNSLYAGVPAKFVKDLI
ncbi:acyltransferase [Jeotgalibaca porci]|uniref:acyltransferase n=1 Tax=Jeotgalibaca porci TaxID=1868793 RepID=UPI003F92DBFC